MQRDLHTIPGSERSPGEENGKPLQYSCLENPMDREAWQATVHRVAENQTRLSDEHTTRLYGLPRWLSEKNLPATVGDMGLIPGSERSPGEENGKPLHYSRLVNSTVTGDWQATIHRVAYYPQGCKESDMTE